MTLEAQMSNHPNFDRAQAALDAIRQGDYAPSFDLYDDDIAWENGPGAGPWHRASGKDDLALMSWSSGRPSVAPFTKTAVASTPMTAWPSA
jgi:ketosteroid isomerase-like protein